MGNIDILVSEVGPRDGLQSIESVMPTEAKKNWIRAEADAGIREIEVGSFVPAKLLPQLADTAEIVAMAGKIDGLSVAALVPNFRGAQDAVRAGVHKMSIPFSVSAAHIQRNLKRTHAEMLDEVRQIAEMLQGIPVSARPFLEGGLATAFGCSIEGKVCEASVVQFAEQLMKAGCDEVGLSDTTGYANPAQIRRLVRSVKSAVGNDKLTGIHLHNTRGLGLANSLAAIEEGITTIDSSLGGLGGCPAAPGASGNIVTEDLVFMLESMGLRTGVDIEKLLNVRQILLDAIPNEQLYGFVPDAGLPKGFSHVAT
jgi:hydroxymethylglutaryl-CoA lyase